MGYFVTAEEIAWAVVIATRHMDDPEEFGKDAEWIVTRAARAGGMPCEPSRAAYYALDALFTLRPRAKHWDIARALGFHPNTSKNVYTYILRRKGVHKSWWSQETAKAIREELIAKIGLIPYEPPPRPEPPRKVALPSPPPSISDQVEIISTAVAPPAPKKPVTVLRDSGSIPLRSAGTQARRPLSPAEAASNAAIFGDPPPHRSALAQRNGGAS